MATDYEKEVCIHCRKLFLTASELAEHLRSCE